MTGYLTRLTPAELSDAGIDGWPYGMADRVRFYELDKLDHVNNVTFLRWFETIRVAYIQDYGLTSYGPDDPQMVVRRQTADYLAPMHQDQDYIVVARTSLIKASSLVMEYAVHSGGELKAYGDAVIISLEQDGRTRRAHRAEARDRIILKDGAKSA